MNHTSNESVVANLHPAKHSGRGGLIIIGLILVGMGVIYFLPYLAGRIDPNKKPDLGNLNPESIDLVILGEPSATFTITNTAELMSLLRVGRPVHNHKCTYRGRLIMHFDSGTNISMYIRPGHTNAGYEFSRNGIFEIPRPAFMSILASEGVDTNQLPVK